MQKIKIYPAVMQPTGTLLSSQPSHTDKGPEITKSRSHTHFFNAILPFGPRRDEVTGEWRRMRNEELNDLYSSPNIVRVIKSRRLRWAGHVARMGEEMGYIGFWWGNRREGDHWGDLGVDV